MKKYILILILLTLPATAYDYAKDGFPPLQPVAQYTNNVNRITQAEQTILGQTYENQNILVRLERLERTVFNRTYPKLSFEQRMNNIIVNYKNTIRKNTNYRELSNLERRFFNRTFNNDLPENRIARLEEQIMGTIQSGDLTTRYQTLRRAAAPYYRSTYSNPNIPIVSNSGGWRGLAGSLTNFFMGYPTGLTPQINAPYLPYDYQRGYYGNHGWEYNNGNYGSGSRVTIIE